MNSLNLSNVTVRFQAALEIAQLLQKALIYGLVSLLVSFVTFGNMLLGKMAMLIMSFWVILTMGFLALCCMTQVLRQITASS